MEFSAETIDALFTCPDEALNAIPRSDDVTIQTILAEHNLSMTLSLSGYPGELDILKDLCWVVSETKPVLDRVKTLNEDQRAMASNEILRWFNDAVKIMADRQKEAIRRAGEVALATEQIQEAQQGLEFGDKGFQENRATIERYFEQQCRKYISENTDSIEKLREALEKDPKRRYRKKDIGQSRVMNIAQLIGDQIFQDCIEKYERDTRTDRNYILRARVETLIAEHDRLAELAQLKEKIYSNPTQAAPQPVAAQPPVSTKNRRKAAGLNQIIKQQHAQVKISTLQRGIREMQATRSRIDASDEDLSYCMEFLKGRKPYRIEFSADKDGSEAYNKLMQDRVDALNFISDGFWEALNWELERNDTLYEQLKPFTTTQGNKHEQNKKIKKIAMLINFPKEALDLLPHKEVLRSARTVMDNVRLQKAVSKVPTPLAARAIYNSLTKADSQTPPADSETSPNASPGP